MSHDKKYFTVLKDYTGKHILPRMIIFDDNVARKIETEGIKFGLVYDRYDNPSGVTIIERNGKHTSQINDRSVSNLVVGKSRVNRDSGMQWNNYSKKAYDSFLKKEAKRDITAYEASAPDYSDLNEIELEFLIEYLTMLVVKKRVEASKKLATIKGKIK